MNVIFKKPACDPCKWRILIAKAKDGDMVAVPQGCETCDYVKCNYVETEEKNPLQVYWDLFQAELLRRGLICEDILGGLPPEPSGMTFMEAVEKIKEAQYRIKQVKDSPILKEQIGNRTGWLETANEFLDEAIAIIVK